ncbi:universal stress protein [Bordetella bronchiseptica]|uniref:Universal stress protein n=2 Tax=Parapusillimonas granuli TaxID=380911 RepID=A0A853G439_9BURK|nr:universal stress protein [Parapusillimonas granuli]
MYSRILVPLDGSPTSILALEYAANLARMSEGTVILMHIIEPTRHKTDFVRPRVYLEDVRPRLLAGGQALLDEAEKRLGQDGTITERVLLESTIERISEQIVRQVEESGCDLIIMGTHGRRGVDRLLLGSDAEQVVRIAPVPVMLVRQPHQNGSN